MIIPILTIQLQFSVSAHELRLRTAATLVLVKYAIFGIIGLAILILLIWFDYLSFWNIPTFIISCSITWGMLHVMMALGYGLVQIPMRECKLTDLSIAHKYFLFNLGIAIFGVAEKQKEILESLDVLQSWKGKFDCLSDVEQENLAKKNRVEKALGEVPNLYKDFKSDNYTKKTPSSTTIK